QGAQGGVVADEVVERLRPILARQHAIRGGRDGSWRRPGALVVVAGQGVVHQASGQREMTNAWPRTRPAYPRCPARSGRLTSDPNRSSLGLLPSGPDPVGEWLVHRQPPRPYIRPTGAESKRRARLIHARGTLWKPKNRPRHDVAPGQVAPRACPCEFPHSAGRFHVSWS